MPRVLEFRDGLLRTHDDVLTPAALDAMAALSPLDLERRELMAARNRRRRERARDGLPIGILDPGSLIANTDIQVRDARFGALGGSDIPPDLQRQWIQGTGPATKPTQLVIGIRHGSRVPERR